MALEHAQVRADTTVRHAGMQRALWLLAAEGAVGERRRLGDNGGRRGRMCARALWL